MFKNAQIRQFGKTNKKKNTYIVAMSNLARLDLFELCRHTPLAIITKNGQTVQPTGTWMITTDFPNPGAHNMVMEYKALKPYMGTLSTTIVEYLDKETGKPVIQLYPTSAHVFDGYESNYMSRLNHASRRDLNYQIKIRQQMIDAYLHSTQIQK